MQAVSRWFHAGVIFRGGCDEGVTPIFNSPLYGQLIRLGPMASAPPGLTKVHWCWPHARRSILTGDSISQHGTAGSVLRACRFYRFIRKIIAVSSAREIMEMQDNLITGCSSWRRDSRHFLTPNAC